MLRQTKLRKEAGIVGLLYASVGGIVGSGWLFGPARAAQEAGPLSLGSWVIGALAVLLLALVFAELGALMPKSGALVHISRVSHGPLLSAIWSWILFLAYVTVAPVEVMAVLTYANSYVGGLVHPDNGLLTPTGLIVSILLLGLLVALNFLVIRWVLLINSAATWWKLAVPGATVVVLIGLSYHPANLQLVQPHAHVQLAGMFTAVATSGVIFSYFGFRQAIDLAGETRNPSRNIPIAVIGSVLIGMALYLALQFAYLVAINPSDLTKGGWSGLRFAGSNGPFAAIAIALGATWWTTILYIDAVVSPAGTAFIYTTAASRITMATGEIGTGPQLLARINGHGVPWVAVLVTFAVGALFFFPFPSWQKLVSYISSVTVLSYSIGPIVLLQLRDSMPDAKRPFRLWAPWLTAPSAFVVSNWIIFWTGLATLSFLFGMLLLLFFGYLLYHYLLGGSRKQPQALGWAHAWWVFPYFGGMWMLTRFGPAAVGGNGTLTLFEGMAAVAILSVIVLWLSLATSASRDETVQAMQEMIAP
ncbi:MAG TPA: APC family permease [Burkholderiaceae bacterium]|nr:APC family permease [Burkholderiaceae bacterium]